MNTEHSYGRKFKLLRLTELMGWCTIFEQFLGLYLDTGSFYPTKQ